MKKVEKQISQKKEEKIQEESQKIDAKKNNLEPASKVDPSKNLSKNMFLGYIYSILKFIVRDWVF